MCHVMALECYTLNRMLCYHGWLDTLYPHFSLWLNNGWPDHPKSLIEVCLFLKCEYRSEACVLLVASSHKAFSSIISLRNWFLVVTTTLDPNSFFLEICHFSGLQPLDSTLNKNINIICTKQNILLQWHHTNSH